MYNKMDNKEKILSKLFEDSEKEFHIRLLSRETGLNPNTIITITNKLAKEDLAEKWKDSERNLVLVKGKTDSQMFKIKKQAYSIEKIYECGLIEFLNKKLSYPAIFLFGSHAKGENLPESDIDLFIIADKKEKIDVSKFENKLKAEIQLFIHTKKELNELKKKSPELINNVLNGIKLAGYLEVL